MYSYLGDIQVIECDVCGRKAYGTDPMDFEMRGWTIYIFSNDGTLFAANLCPLCSAKTKED